jgi:hypothetical protein
MLIMDLSLFKNKYPFSLNGLTRQQKSFKEKRGVNMVDITTGVVEDNPAIVLREIVPAGKFTKFRTDAIAGVYGLKPTSRLIVDYLFANMPQDTPVIAFDIHILTAFFRGLKNDIKIGKNGCVMSYRAFYTALRELQEKSIIATSGNTGFWFVNMTVLHNGNTTTIVRVIEKDIREKTEKDKLEDAGQQRLID